MKDNTITIAVPVYGVERYIARCARSLFEQTYESIDYLFVDDCSSDNSIGILKEVIKEYPNRASHVRLIRHNINRGLAAARNTAVENCMTEWIMHVDSDDWIEQNAIELMVNKQKETNADIVNARVLRHTQTGDIELVVSEEDEKEQFVLSTLGYDFHHILCSRLVRKSLYDVGKICAEEGTNLGEDWQVVPKLAWNAQTFAHLNVVTYHYDCMNTDSYVNKKNKYNHHHFEQDYRSWEIANDFFCDKEEIYRKRLHESGEELLYNYLYCAVKAKDKQAFNTIKCKLMNLSPYFFKGGISRKKLVMPLKKYYTLFRLIILIRE